MREGEGIERRRLRLGLSLRCRLRVIDELVLRRLCALTLTVTDKSEGLAHMNDNGLRVIF